MKRSFLLTLLIASVAHVAHAQMTSRPNPKDIEADIKKTQFDKFSERLRISYFGVFTSPTFHDMEKGNWEYAATSSKTSSFPGNRDSIPVNLFNQISFNYNFGAKLNFVVNPRFSLWFARPKDSTENIDNSTVQLEDMLVGFQGVIYSSDDKKFNLWIRPGARLPTSRTSRDSGNAGFGTTSQQLELAMNPTYDINKKWQIAAFTQWRTWIFEDRYNYSRLRFYTAPYIQYTIDDTTRLQLWYESFYENNKRWKTIKNKSPNINAKKDPLFQDLWQDVYFGVSKDITPKFNLFPFIGCFIDNAPITNKSFYIGGWISYQIK